MKKSMLRALCVAVASPCWSPRSRRGPAQPLTPRSVVAKLDSLKLSYEVPNSASAANTTSPVPMPGQGR